MYPKKSLGQNFLRDRVVLKKIIKAADLKADSLVLEVGPGEGVLTQKLSRRADKIICIEKDNLLAKKLVKNFQFPIFDFQSISDSLVLNFENKVAVISGDILKINLPGLIRENNFQNYKVVANIPYYITSPIIQLFLESETPPREMILMVQKEVAERICASPGKMSILAVSVQYYAKAELLFYVDRKSFFPVPEVDSAVIRITTSKKHPTKKERKRFFRVVRAGFSARRKTLLNNLSNSLHLEKEAAFRILKKSGLRPEQRPQELGVEDWEKIACQREIRAD